MSEQPLNHSPEEELLRLRRALDEANRRAESLQTELDEQRSFTDALLGATPDFFVLKDTDFRYRRVNPSFCRFLGKRAEEIVGKTNEELFSAEDAALYSGRDADILKNRKPLEGDWSIVGSQGRFWFRVKKMPLFDVAGQVTAILCIARDISPIKKAEIEFERLFNLMPDMACIASSSGYFTKVNKVWTQTLGYSEQELLAVPYINFIHPDDLAATKAEVSRKYSGQEGTLNFVNRYRASDGSYHWLEWNSTPIEEGFLYAVARDITERIEQGRQMRLWADAFRLCAHGIAIGLPETNQVLACNEAFARLCGRPVSEIEGAGIESLYVPEDREMVMSNIRTVDRTGFVSYQARMFRAGSSAFFAQMDVVSVRGDDGKLMYRVATVQDITERLKSQLALRKSEERFRSVVQSAPDAIFIQTNECFSYLNDRALALFGASSPDQMLGRKVLDMTHPDYREMVGKRMRRVNTSRQALPVIEERLLRLDGSAVSVEASAVPFTFSGKHGGLVFLRDISRRKNAEKDRAELEQQLFQSQKIESIGRLAGGIAHDLNNLLTPILGYSEMLLKRLREPEKPRQYVEVIHHAALKSRELVRQLLAFSSRQSLELRTIDLNDVILDFEQLLRRTIRADIDIRYHLNEQPLPMRGDASQLEQILMNLAVNAEDAMPSGGELVMETSTLVIRKGQEKYYEGLSAGSYALLTVRDNGEGMDQQTLAQLFEPFFTTKPKGKGTGLGLSTVYGIVRQHGGIIQVGSERGAGTCFKICLPMQQHEVQELPVSEPVDKPPEGGAKVLVVEDDELVRKFVVQALMEAGFTIREAEGGEEALALIEKDGFIPDLLLSDLVMRGMNGRALYERIHEMLPSIRVIYMSGYAKNIISSQGILNEGLTFLQKPFAVPVLLDKVRSVLQNGKKGAETKDRKKPKPKL